MQWHSWCFNIITPGHWALKPFLKPSQLPWEYTACAAKYVAHYKLNQPQEPSLPSQIPIYTPGWKGIFKLN